MKIEKIKLNKLKFLGFVIFLLLFAGIFLLTEKYSQFFHFVDEDDHIVFGYFMNRGYKLYQDLSSNHQPLVYFLSSLYQKLFQPESLFVLIKRAREIVFLYAFIWSLFLFFQYGLVFLAFALFFELTKFFLFGNLLLAESLAVYPLIFVLGETFKAVFLNYKPKKYQSFVFGLSNFMVVFNLLPLIPSLLILDFIYLIKTKDFKKVILGFLFPAVFLFLFISPFEWFREVVVYNFKYVTPALSPIKQKTDYLLLLAFPILSFFKAKSSIFNLYLQFFSLLLIALLLIYFFIKRKRFKKIETRKEMLSLLFLLLAVLLLNNRVLVPGEMHYQGFHLLPWYAAFIFFTLLMMKLVFQNINKKFMVFLGIIILLSSFYLLTQPSMPYFAKIDKNRDHNVNFYPYYLTGQGIKALSQSDDRLIIIPDESLLYWTSELKPAGRQIVHYEWEYWVPDLRKDFDLILNENKVEFIYAPYDRIGPASYLPVLTSVLEKDYYQIIRQGVAQPLYIKKERIGSISDQQWQEWNRLGFDKINLEEVK